MTDKIAEHLHNVAPVYKNIRKLAKLMTKKGMSTNDAIFQWDLRYIESMSDSTLEALNKALNTTIRILNTEEETEA